MGAMVGVGLGLVMVLADRSVLPGLVTPFSRAFISLTPLGFLAVLIFCMYLGIAIHETGHLIFGLLAGLRFNFISFGPLLINREFKASLHWKRRTGAGGVTSMVPNGSDRLRSRLLFMILGGPLANLISAAVALVLKSGSGSFASALSGFIMISATMGLANLIPFRSASSVSDGRRIWFLLSYGRKGARWLALIQLGGALIDGTEPDRLDKAMLKASISFTDNSPDTVAAHSLAYMAAFADHQDDQAARLLETCLAFCRFTAPSGRESLFISAAVFQARRRRRTDLAEQWLAAVPASTRTPGLRPQAEAAILEAQGNIEQALFKLEESIEASNAIAQPSLRTVSLALLKRWEKELSEKALAAQ